MEKRMKFAQGMTGLLSLSALAIGFANDAGAAALAGSNATQVHGISSYVKTNGGMGVFAPASAINITNSRHNLGTTNTLGTNHTLGSSGTGPGGTSVLDAGLNVVGTNQICVFCHTPHGFNAVQSGPLWNKAVNASTAYAVYNTGSNNSSTLDADPPSIGSVSLACLSCHDGTQAMDNMINGPGSGLMAAGYDGSLSSNASSKFLIGGANPAQSQAYVWANAGGGFGQMSQGGAGWTNAGNTTDHPALEGILIGTDLSNDHPISMQYCGGGIMAVNTKSTVAGAAADIADGSCRDRLFNLPTVQYLNGAQRFWVDTNTIQDTDAVAAGAASTGGATANPITRNPATLAVYVTTNTTLATANTATASGIAVSAQNSTMCGIGNSGDGCGRGFIASVGNGSSVIKVPGFGIRSKQDIMLFTNNAGVNGPSVECASCHDPHTPNNGTFLRVSNQGSGLCLSCHVK